MRAGFLAMGLALGGVLSAVSLVGLSAVHAPGEVSLEHRAVLTVPMDQALRAIEEPTFWLRWDSLIGELTEEEDGSGVGQSGDRTYKALLMVAGRNVPARIRLLTPHKRHEITWEASWAEASAVQGFRFGIGLESRGGETEAIYRVSYHLPGFGARLANSLALEAGVKEGMVQSLSGLDRWIREQRLP